MSDDVPVVSVPVAELIEARVVRTQTAERPLVQAVIGLALTALGLVFATRIARWAIEGGTITDIDALMLGWLIAGPWVLASAVRRGVVLRARTRRTTRKLIVGKDATIEELRAFAGRAQTEYGIHIGVELG